jgi:dTMP kinase
VRKGIWITFEGIEGTGKTTQVERLARRLDAGGVRTTLTREPGGTELGQQLRSLLLRPDDEPMHPMTELLLYTADRAQHLAEVILPALERGEVVLCDRFLDATLAYQGYARGLGTACVLELHRRAPLDSRPHRTVLLDLDPEEGLARALRRNAGNGLDSTEGRFEHEHVEFHRRVRAGYLALASAEPERFRLVDGAGTPDEVEARVFAAVRDLPFPGEARP